MPRSLEGERSVLGALLLDNLAYYEATSLRVLPEYFHSDSHRRIFRAIQRLFADHKPVDTVTLVEELIRGKEVQLVGGPEYVASLLDGVPDRPSIRHYCEILKDRYMRRQVIAKANRAIACAIDQSDPIDFTIGGLNHDLLKLQGDVIEDGKFVCEYSTQALKSVEDWMYVNYDVMGLPFGIAELDEVTTGIRRGEFVVVGGYPGSGKSSFGLGVARNISKKHVVAFFSVEMLREALILRLFSQISGISLAKLRSPKNLHSSEFRQLEAYKADFDKLQLIVDDNARDINEMIPRAHLYVQRNKAELIVVDYLQILGSPGEKEYERVSHAADALTAFAKDTGVPVLCLSQLSRPEDKKNAANIIPTINMLRSSGKIEQNAHLVLFTYHPENESGDATGEDLIVIGKQREGVKGHVKSYFHGPTQTWTERESPKEAPQESFFTTGA
jgi:replicative DNA helicase